MYTSFSFGVGGAVGGVLAGYAWGTIGPAWMYTAMAVVVMAGWLFARMVKQPQLSQQDNSAG